MPLMKIRLFRSLKFRMVAVFSSLLCLLVGTAFLGIYQSRSRTLSQNLDQNMVFHLEILSGSYNDLVQLAYESDEEEDYEGLSLEEENKLIDQSFSTLEREHDSLFKLTSQDILLLSAQGHLIKKLSKSKEEFNLLAKQLDINQVDKLLQISNGTLQYSILMTKNLDGTYLCLLNNKADLVQDLSKLKLVLLVAFLVIVAIGTFLCTKVVYASLKGFETVRQTADQIAQGDYQHRVELSSSMATEVQDLALSFNQMLERTEALISEIQEVTNNVAHDLRTPLTRIRGKVETTMMEAADLEKHQELSGIVIEECDKFMAIINDMLLLAEYESGLVPDKGEIFSLQVLLTEMEEVFSSVSEDSQISLILDLPNDEVPIRGDLKKMQRALANLLDNAIKYSEKKTTISISLKLTRDCFCELKISDCGIGISQEDQKRIFERFYRVDRSRHTMGNGLGLNLAKAFIENQGGSLSVESEIDMGSVFTVVLPVNPKNTQI